MGDNRLGALFEIGVIFLGGTGLVGVPTGLTDVGVEFPLVALVWPLIISALMSLSLWNILLCCGCEKESILMKMASLIMGTLADKLLMSIQPSLK